MVLILAPLSKTKAWAKTYPWDWFGTGLAPILTLLGKTLATMAFSGDKLDKEDIIVGQPGSATTDPRTEVSF